MFIKGISEVNIAPSQTDALEMILIRVAYSANLPTPNELLDGLKKNSNLTVSPTQFNNEINIAKDGESKEAIIFDTPQQLVDYLVSTKKMMLSYSIKNDISFEEFSNGTRHCKTKVRVDVDFAN